MATVKREGTEKDLCSLGSGERQERDLGVNREDPCSLGSGERQERNLGGNREELCPVGSKERHERDLGGNREDLCPVRQERDRAGFSGFRRERDWAVCVVREILCI